MTMFRNQGSGSGVSCADRGAHRFQAAGRGRIAESMRVLVAVAFLLCARAPGAQGAILFTNLGPGDSYNDSAAWDVNSTGSKAGRFTPAQTATLDGIRLPLSRFLSEVQPIVISLREPALDPSGAILESWMLPPADVQVGGDGGIVTLASVLKPALSNMSSYWLRVDSASLTLGYLWYVNSTGDKEFANLIGSSWGVAPSAPAPAFEVIGSTVVPEPASLLLLSSGLLLAARRLRRRVATWPGKRSSRCEFLKQL
jgi:hypothetical protein